MYLYEEAFCYEFQIFNENFGKRLVLTNENELNNIFFLTLYNFIEILIKKSCFKSALSYTKLLLKISPINDPYNALLLIDKVAMLARQY